MASSSNNKETVENKLSKFDSDLSKITQEKKEIEDEIFLFISFDLKDSTKIKSEHKTQWASIIMDLYYLISSAMKNKFDNKFILWKYIGDEILFYGNIKSFLRINSFLDTLCIIQSNSSNELTKKFSFPIFIKTTTWIADTKYYETLGPKEKYNNIKFYSTEASSNYDFLGIDIDIGFRIAAYSYPDAITVSAKLAYLLTKNKDNTFNNETMLKNNFKILSYRKLKGVWEGHYYPIIWYSTNWDKLKEAPYEDILTKEELLNENKFHENITNIEYLKTILNQRKENYSIFVRKCLDLINSEQSPVIKLSPELLSNKK